MQYLKTYLKKITDRGNTKLAESIEKTANDVGNKHIKTFSTSRVFHFAVMRLDCFLEMFSLEKRARCLGLYVKRQI